MCLYPKIIGNNKYKANKKNLGIIPQYKDERVLKVAIGCGMCIECRKMKKREWQMRLTEEIKEYKENELKFVTLTFNEEKLKELIDEIGDNEANDIATLACRRFLERWRKKYKKSVKHWLITELGHKGTERIHMHGILFTDKNKEEIEERWQNGMVWVGEYVNEETVNYIIKYVTKIDLEHKGFKGKILTSAGIGKKYIEQKSSRNNTYIKGKTDEGYRLNNGTKIPLPIYIRNKVYTEEQREDLWLEKLDKNIRYIMGKPFNMNNEKEKIAFFKTQEFEQKKNIRLGYGSDDKEWKKKSYEAQLKDLEKKT